MIVSYSFKGDNYDNVKWIQHDQYGVALRMIFDEARRLYLRSARILNVSTDVSEKIILVDSFDHRVLQAGHDLIAAYFRYSRAVNLHPYLFEQEIPEEKRIAKMWLRWLDGHLPKLYEEAVIVRAVCTAVAFENTERGYKAEDLLVRLLQERYYELDGIEYVNKAELPFCKICEYGN